jgi:hypothetical protein
VLVARYVFFKAVSHTVQRAIWTALVAGLKHIYIRTRWVQVWLANCTALEQEVALKIVNVDDLKVPLVSYAS